MEFVVESQYVGNFSKATDFLCVLRVWPILYMMMVYIISEAFNAFDLNNYIIVSSFVVQISDFAIIILHSVCLCGVWGGVRAQRTL